MSDIKERSNRPQGWLFIILALLAIALIAGLLVFILNNAKSPEQPPIFIDKPNEISTGISAEKPTETSEEKTFSEDVKESQTDSSSPMTDAGDSVSDISSEAVTPDVSPEVSEPESSFEETPVLDGLSWTSFDGYTFGNCESTYGSIYTQAELQAMDSTKQGFGPGTKMDAANRPLGALNPQEKYAKYGAIFIGDDTPNIYLTMDEGYENGYTAQILDKLKEADCKAVFFVTYPYVKQNKDLVQRMIDEGHVVGNHSVNHKSMPTLSLEDASKEITKLHNYMLENFNYEMYLFRPPMGEFSEQTLALSQSLGYRSVLWSFAYLDYDTANQPEPEKALKKIIKAKHGGAVYLLHAVSATNTEILTEVIDAFRNENYEVGPIPR